MLDHTAYQAAAVALPPRSNENPMTALYRAAVGPIHADRYLPIFERLDTAGRPLPRWNWAAALCTLNWMLFRRLWGAALVYVAALEAVGLLVFAIGRQVLQLPLPIFSGLVLAFVLIACAAPGLYGDAIFHAEVRKRITKALSASATLPQAAELLSKQAANWRRLGWIAAGNVALALAIAAAYVLLPGGNPFVDDALTPPPATQPVTEASAPVAKPAAASPAVPASAPASAPMASASAAAHEAAAPAELPASAPETIAPPAPSTAVPTPASIPPAVSTPATTAAAPPTATPSTSPTAAPRTAPALSATPESRQATTPARAASPPPAAKAPASSAARPPAPAASRPAPAPRATRPAVPASAATPATRPAAAAASAASAPAARRLFINVGLFADPDNARRAHARLREAGLPATTDPVTTSAGKRLTRVRVGPFASSSEANAATERVRALGLDAAAHQQ